MRFELNKIKLNKGQDEQFILVLLDENKEPFQIHGASTITLKLLKADNTIFEKAPYTGFTWGIGNCVWAYNWLLTAADIEDLPLKADMSVELKIGFGSSYKYLVLDKCLTVTKLPF